MRQKSLIKRSFLLYFLIHLLTSEPSYAGVPDWFKTHKHPAYPPARYIIGVGSGNTREAAIQRAQADIVSQIELRISSTIEIKDSEKSTDSVTTIQSSITSVIKTEARHVLSGAQIIEVKEHKGTFFALSVLDKIRYARQLSEESKELSKTVDTLKESAINLIRKGKFSLAIAEFDSILKTLLNIQTKGNTYTALTGHTLPYLQTYSPARISSTLKAILSNISLKIVSFPEKVGILGKSFSSPLCVKAIFLEEGKEIGLEGMPLLLEYETGELIESKVTDFRGNCSFNIIAIPTGADNKTGRTRVKFNTDKLPKLAVNHLKDIYTEYSYKVETLIEGFDLHITDVGGSRYPQLESYIEQKLSELGLKTTDKSDYIIEGRVMITKDKEIKTPLTRMVYIELILDLEIQSKISGEVLSTMRINSSGLNGTFPDAVRTAIKNIKIDKIEFTRFIGKTLK